MGVQAHPFRSRLGRQGDAFLLGHRLQLILGFCVILDHALPEVFNRLVMPLSLGELSQFDFADVDLSRILDEGFASRHVLVLRCADGYECQHSKDKRGY